MPDTGDERGSGGRLDASYEGLALRAVGGVDPYLDQLVMCETALDLREHAGARAGLADDDQRFEAVRAGAQGVSLLPGQIHNELERLSTMQGEPAPKVACPRRGFSIAPSPLNGVKLELGLILVVGMLLAVVHARIAHGVLAQLVLLGGYGLAAMAWLLVRTHRVLRRQARDRTAARRP